MLCLICLFLHVALLDKTPSSCFFLISQESDVAVHCRIREFFIVPSSLGNVCCAARLWRPSTSRSAEINDTVPLASISWPLRRSNKYMTRFRIKSSMPLSQRWTPKFKTSSTRRHGDSTLVSSSLPLRCVRVCHGRFVFMGHVEFNFPRNDGGQWFHPDQQILRRSSQCALLRRQRVDR